jgi:hypothetical protein
MDGARAFRAAGEVQNAYRKLSDAAELINGVIEIRRQMCNNAGNAAAIDFPQPNVFTPPLPRGTSIRPGQQFLRLGEGRHLAGWRHVDVGSASRAALCRG